MSTYAWVDVNSWFSRIGDRGILGYAMLSPWLGLYFAFPVRNILNRCHVGLVLRFTLNSERKGSVCVLGLRIWRIFDHVGW